MGVGYNVTAQDGLRAVQSSVIATYYSERDKDPSDPTVEDMG